MAQKVLWANKWMSVVQQDGWYTFVRSNAGDGVSVLGYRKDPNKNSFETADDYQYLIRIESTPCHGPGLRSTSLTGTIEGDLDHLETAQKELLEESGYSALPEELQYLGWVYPSKFSDYVQYLYAVDLTGKPQGEILGDGTLGEKDATVQWVSLASALRVHDPSVSAIIVRLWCL